MGLPFWDDPGGPCVKPYSRMHGRRELSKKRYYFKLAGFDNHLSIPYNSPSRYEL